MKILLATLLISILTCSSSAQLSIKNTQWKGYIGSQGDVKMEFKSDTCYMYRNGSEVISIFAFSQSQDTVTIFKAGGIGPCPMNGKGIYHIEMMEKGEKLSLHLVSEECPGRGIGLTSSAFERIH